MLRLKLLCVLFWFVFSAPSYAAPAPGVDDPYASRIAPASDEGALALKRFKIPKGFQVELVASEPSLANPVAFCIDEQGRFYVAETFRHHAGVTDIRGHMNWLDDDLAAKSVEDRVKMLRKFEGQRIGLYTNETDRVRLLVDTDNDGKVDKATVFSDGYNGIADGIGSGVLAHRGAVYYANIPHLWLLHDKNGDGRAETKKSLLSGFGVRVGFLGHDLHGLTVGPDGKIYFSIGDRGAHVPTGRNKAVENHETGAVYRCNPDGSELEIFAYGLRNPQELAFDKYGNLWTGENNSDGGDPARWVYLVDGGDSGWRIGYQFITSPNNRGPWLAERMCYPQWEGQPAYILPPLANIGNGPSGLTYNPGTGFPPNLDDHFFMCDFRGVTGSGIYAIGVKPKGASFEVTERSEFVWEVLVTDCDFGYDGALYLTDWVEGWQKPGKGRIYRVFNPATRQDPVVAQTKKLFAEGWKGRSENELAELLKHRDQRVRREAQFALVDKKAVKILERIFTRETNEMARLHALWGLGQLPQAKREVVRAMGDKDPEIRAQAAKIVGERRITSGAAALRELLGDGQVRPRFFAAIAAGKLKLRDATPALVKLLGENNDKDVYLRHAAVMGLVGCADEKQLASLAKHEARAVRMGAVLALRRLRSPKLAEFLNDADALVLLEAARAISDEPVPGALPMLAGLLQDSGRLSKVATDLERYSTVKNSADKVDLGAALYRRVVNANFRLGNEIAAQRLGAVTTADGVPETTKTEALLCLGEWRRPSGRDRVTGLWRPLSPRPREEAVAAVESLLPKVMRSSSGALRAAALKAGADLEVGAVGEYAAQLATDRAQKPSARVEALKALARRNDSHLADTLKTALSDPDETVRREATKIQARLRPADASQQLQALLDNGSIREKQTAFAALGGMTNNPTAEKLLETWLDKLLAGEVPPELQLDVLAAAAVPDSNALKDKLRKVENQRDAKDDLRAWRECLVGGNADEGKKVFAEKVEVSCIRCHKAEGEGGEAGPDLKGIGARQTREYILQSIVLPNAQIAAGFESVLVTTKTGTTYAGTIKSENETMIELNSPEDGILQIKKENIKSRDRGLSGMPEEIRQVLSKQELRNLVEYLANLKN